MKTALIAGATGLVGGELLKQLSEDKRYEKIIVLSRRKLPVQYPKTEVIVSSFDTLESLSLPCPIDVVYCALGTTRGKAGKAGQYKVDYEYVVKLAQLSALQGGKFLVVSSQGANARSAFFYMKTKGEMEESVKKTGNRSIYIMRPSLILGKRQETRIAEKIGIMLYTLFAPLMIGSLRKSRAVSATKIARCMIAMAEKDDAGIFTIASETIQQY
ncbi:MAG: NAD(P)H-binding protein [Bacteroidales bacterium]|nr:NAD(P)H-binding protein [Bacteroidales bacterium]